MQDRATEKELKRLKAITRIHHSIGTNLRLEEISRILVRELVEIVNCDMCAILLIKNNKVEILAETGFPKTFGKLNFDLDMPAINYIVQTKECISTNDVLNSTATSCLPKGYSMQSLICTPIMANNEVHGIIHLDSLKKNAFDEDDIELTKLLANEVSIAIERSFLYSQIWDISVRDGLTECFNRRKFDVDIVAEIANAKQHRDPLSMLMMDIDWFKNYNDFYGHPKGDIALKQVSTTLISNLRPLDHVYRYGGEEFAVLLPDTNRKEALLIAERLRRLIEKEDIEGEKESQPNSQLTISIGVAIFPIDANKESRLIEAADSALYKAKQAGRNKVCIYNKKPQRHSPFLSPS